jgi:hypothetical protein
LGGEKLQTYSSPTKPQHFQNWGTRVSGGVQSFEYPSTKKRKRKEKK